MKKITYVLLLFVTIACHRENKNEVKKPEGQKEEARHATTHFNLIDSTQPALKNWILYYKTRDASFSLKNFKHNITQPLHRIPGAVPGNFDEGFDHIYDPFLIHAPDNKRYIDIDSYLWVRDGGKEMISFSPDQEINLVNKELKTVERIAFRGPSQWVEDAFWVNDSIVGLLENSDEKVPYLTLIRLFDNSIEFYQYKDTLNFTSAFYQKRLTDKGLKID